MLYTCRHMTPEEREEVVAQRQARGYPLHSPPHQFRGPGQYLITAANYEHRHVKANPGRRTDFEARLLEGLQEMEVETYAWVVLSNHYHALVGVKKLNDVSVALKNPHGAKSREWNLEDGVVGKRQTWYHYYLSARGRDWSRETWQNFRPDSMGNGWDDYVLDQGGAPMRS
jgi:putative transposase